MFNFSQNVSSYLEIWKRKKNKMIGQLKKMLKEKIILREELVLPDIKTFTKPPSIKILCNWHKKNYTSRIQFYTELDAIIYQID